MPLPVSGAFHTPFMAPARDRLRKAIADGQPSRHRGPGRLQRRRPGARPGRRVGEPALRPAVAARSAGSTVCCTLRSLGVTDFARARPRRRAHRDGQAHRRRRPDDLRLDPRRPRQAARFHRHHAPPATDRARGRAPVRRRAGGRQPGGRGVHPGRGFDHRRPDRGRDGARPGRPTTRSARRSPACCRATSPSLGERVTARQPIAWLRTSLICREFLLAHHRWGDHRVGNRAPTEGRDQRRSGTFDRHLRTSGSSSAPASTSATSAAPPSGCRSRPVARRSRCSGVDPSTIDALVLATTTPDRTVPATSATVQHELGLRCGAFDVNAACSGFVYALVTAHGLIATGRARSW